MVHHVSNIISRRNGKLRDLLVFIGDNTLFIFIFHILSFKAVSILKIWYYDLPWEQIGCHMVIHDYKGDLFWILYSFVGVALPLVGVTLYRRYMRGRGEEFARRAMSAMLRRG